MKNLKFIGCVLLVLMLGLAASAVIALVAFYLVACGGYHSIC